ncbi:hypothetical protein ACFYRD_23930 [Streptomyces hirsutus]|uniref:hypothetical protein n=1 Tax=Streptomyces hirsutus TaxID=35620 RepID=UPI0036A56A9D
MGLQHGHVVAQPGERVGVQPAEFVQWHGVADARRGVVPVRSEYPQALAHIREAVERAYTDGHFGPSAHGTDTALDVEVVEGAGSYVAGEETALIARLEGDRGCARRTRPGADCGMRRPW